MPHDPSNLSASFLTVGERDGAPALAGSLDARTVPDARKALAAADKTGKGAIDLSGLSGLDTAGALVLCTWEEGGGSLVLAGPRFEAAKAALANTRGVAAKQRHHRRNHRDGN